MTLSAPAPRAFTMSPEVRTAAAIGDGGDTVFAAFGGGFHDGGELRHADAGDDAGGADAARANADFHRVRPGTDEGGGAFGGGDVAGDDLDGVGEFLDALDRGEHAGGVAVGGVHHDDVDIGVDQRLGAGRTVIAHAGGGGDAQAAQFVLVRDGVGLRLVHVLHGDEASTQR